MLWQCRGSGVSMFGVQNETSINCYGWFYMEIQMIKNTFRWNICSSEIHGKLNICSEIGHTQH